MTTDAKITAARAFVRSLNILLKFARLYGFDHTRTTEQFDTAWDELRAAIPASGEAGLLLAAASGQLLVDGLPMDSAPVERNFAQMLSSAGLASIHFSPRISRDDLAHFARAFPSGNAKASALAAQLKAALAGRSGIRINEIRFVPEDEMTVEAKIAAQLTAQALGAGAEDLREALQDPRKLLQLIAAAEGSKAGGGAGSGSGPGDGSGEGAGGGGAETGSTGTRGGGGSGSGGGGGSGWGSGIAAGTGSGPATGAQGGTGKGLGGDVTEDDFLGVIRLLSHLGEASRQPSGSSQIGPFQESLAKMPATTQDILRQALASLAAQAPERPDEPVLLRLAEHLAIRFALERYERGEVKVNAVRQMIEKMSLELGNLRKILGAHEEKMARAGMVVESHADILDRQFWAAVPESGKQAVLTSPEAWCIPPRNARQYIELLLERGDKETASGILLNYASGINLEDPLARRKAAFGLSELADLYAGGDAAVFLAAIRQAGGQLTLERDEELQGLVSAAFVRLSQEAITRRCYSALLQSLGSLDGVENQRPGFAQTLRSRLGLENRLPELIEEVLHAERVAEGLKDVLRRMPIAAVDQLAARFNRSGYREDGDRLVALAQSLGEESLRHLRDTLRAGQPQDAVETIGLLSRLDSTGLEAFLPQSVREWSRPLQDRGIRLLAAGGAPERGRLLLSLLDGLDPLLLPLAIDEIGMSGDAATVTRLASIAEGSAPEGRAPFVRLKAVEALGRLRAKAGAMSLRRILESRVVWRWTNPAELRIAALQALDKVEPEWAREFEPKSGLNSADLCMPALDADAGSHWMRHRRHTRIRLPRHLQAVSAQSRENYRLEIKTFSLDGGVAAIERHVPPGTQVELKMLSGLRGVRATVLMRDYRAQDMAFEIVDMDLEERNRLRKLLASFANPSTLVT